MTILTKLKELGISIYDAGYNEMSRHFNDWIRGGDTWKGQVDFVRWNRRAEVVLPTKPGAVATCNLVVHNY